METRILRILAWSLLVLLGLLAACSSDDDEFIPNELPDTRIIIAPSSTLPVSYRVEFAWLGSDPDGLIDAYDWRISDDGANGIVDVGDTLGLPWQRTVRSDSLFDASAELDSFPPDVENPVITDPIDFRWWQNHTFWVRAVDQKGAVDPTPASSRFTATTTAPTIAIDIPTDLPRDGGAAKQAECFLTNPVLAVGVKTVDLDDPLGIADEYRYALLAVQDLDPAAYAALGIPNLNAGECLGYDDFVQLDLLPYVPEEAWSIWMEYVVTDDPSIDFTLPALELGSSWFLFLQARDRARALTPTLRYNLNFFEFKVEGGFAPQLTVLDPNDDEYVFDEDTMLPVAIDLQGDGEYRFQWSGDATSYAGVVTGYRYAVDPVDPSNVDELEWATPWSPLQITLLTLSDGPHSLVVAVQDNSGEVRQAEFSLTVSNTSN